MTRILSIDPGLNTGIALGYFDAITPYRLNERWQIDGGVRAFADWLDEQCLETFDGIIVVERFVLADNDFTPDLTPKKIEGLLEKIDKERAAGGYSPIVWQPRTDKAALTGYPKTAKTKAKRQRVRFDFLERFGMFAPGTQNDDSNDAVVHGLVYLKRRRHMPTLLLMWPPPRPLI